MGNKGVDVKCKGIVSDKGEQFVLNNGDSGRHRV